MIASIISEAFGIKTESPKKKDIIQYKNHKLTNGQSELLSRCSVHHKKQRRKKIHKNSLTVKPTDKIFLE